MIIGMTPFYDGVVDQVGIMNMFPFLLFCPFLVGRDYFYVSSSYIIFQCFTRLNTC